MKISCQMPPSENTFKCPLSNSHNSFEFLFVKNMSQFNLLNKL